MILRFRPLFTDDWSDASFAGESAEAATAILVAHLLRLDYEVEVCAEGEWIDFEEYEHDTEG